MPKVEAIQDNKVVAANLAAQNLFEKSSDELLSSTFTKLVNPEHTETIGKIDSLGEVEASMTKEDGSLMQAIFSSTSFFWNDLPASLITVKDVSKLKSFEHALRNYRDSCVDMIICFKPDFTITFVNEPFCKYYGKSKSEVLGLDFRDILNTDEKNILMMNLDGLTKQNPQRRFQSTIKSDGVVRLQEWIDHASFDGDLISEYQRVGRDITNMFK